ncbi:MAG: SDR family oxidoreductase [Lacunisphaera sp.]
MRIVITGTSSGIGRALAERFLADEHEVWGLARSLQTGLGSRWPLFHPLVVDVSDWVQVAAAAQTITAAGPGLDALITCAGLHGEIGRTLTTDPARWTATVHANLAGTFHALRAFHPALTAAGRRAKIVCFSGGGATKSRPNFSAYGVAKTGIVRLVETIAEEERGRPLDINALAPGAINTRLTDEVIALGATVVGEAEYQTAFQQKQSGGGSLEKVLRLVEWLLSPASDGISGRLLSAPWDPWPGLAARADKLADSDIYTLRRVVPEDRGEKWT